MENASHELTSQEVPQVEKSPCGRSYIKREELLQALPIGEDTGVSPGKPMNMMDNTIKESLHMECLAPVNGLT